MLKQLFTIVLCGLLFGSLHFVLRKTRLVDVAGSFGARTSKFFATAHAVASPREGLHDNGYPGYGCTWVAENRSEQTETLVN